MGFISSELVVIRVPSYLDVGPIILMYHAAKFFLLLLMQILPRSEWLFSIGLNSRLRFPAATFKLYVRR